MKNYRLLIFLAFFSFLVISCEDDKDEVNPNEKGEIVIEFDNIVGYKDLILSNGSYTNSSNESFSITTLQYYISNIKLKNANGTEYVVPQDESYFLVREHVEESREIKLQVPEGDYTEITFMIGVDSLRNTMDVSARKGVLDIGDENTGKSMYWSWNSGYIFYKIEGTSPQSPLDNNIFFYHVGGFGGYSSPTVNNIRTQKLSFGTDKAMVRHDKTPTVHLTMDVLKVFDGTTKISIAANPSSHFSSWSSNVANNYLNAFKYEHIHHDNGHSH
ncbi:MAG: hypothetical protein OHK0038_06490 [Flammeovirgaceae bacterium]